MTSSEHARGAALGGASTCLVLAGAYGLADQWFYALIYTSAAGAIFGLVAIVAGLQMIREHSRG